MRLTVFSHKKIWTSKNTPLGYATDGGFAFHMKALSSIFNETILVLPLINNSSTNGEIEFDGKNIKISIVENIKGSEFVRKIRFPFWLFANMSTLMKSIYSSDAIHVPIPSDLGLIPMLIADFLKKPLYVRHCGNWLKPSTSTEKFLKWYMQRRAGHEKLMLATGGSSNPPSAKNQNIKWIFSSSLWEEELEGLRKKRQNKFNSEHKEKFKIVIAARQNSNKGTEEVIRSLPLLGEYKKNVTFTVIGDGNRLEFLKNLTIDLDCTNEVIFTGKLTHDELLNELLAADIFCYPTSASEGFPKVVLEAMASGLPVLATPVSVIPILLNKGCGIILDSKEPEYIANKILECMRSPDLLTQMGLRAQEVASEFTLEKWRNTIRENMEISWGTKMPELA